MQIGEACWKHPGEHPRDSSALGNAPRLCNHHPGLLLTCRCSAALNWVQVQLKVCQQWCCFCPPGISGLISAKMGILRMIHNSKPLAGFFIYPFTSQVVAAAVASCYLSPQSYLGSHVPRPWTSQSPVSAWGTWQCEARPVQPAEGPSCPLPTGAEPDCSYSTAPVCSFAEKLLRPQILRFQMSV